jgi:hydrogenase nickel incorporation protein HypA/HybF
MHEQALLRDLVRAVRETARSQGLRRVTVVRLRVGALSHLTGPALVAGWPDAATGTAAAAARLEIETSSDLEDPRAQGVVLVAIDGLDDLPDVEATAASPGPGPPSS